MTDVCPNGHDTTAPDLCDECGTVLVPRPPDDDTAPVVTGDPCPVCLRPREPGETYCEQCGFDLTSDELPRWVATIATDHDFYDRLDIELAFPGGSEPWTVALDRDEMSIGRPTPDNPVVPHVALDDPHVSRRHARLARCPDGGLELSDDGSSNGTYVNGTSEPLAVGIVRRVVAGDRINVGAWTRITVTVAPRS